MAYKSKDSNLANFIYGWGTSTSYGGYSTSKVNDHFSIGGLPVRAVLKNSTFMPFSNQPEISGFDAGGSPILSVGKYAGVNRFVKDVTVRFSSKTNSSSRVTLSYLGGGSYNSLGTLKVGNTTISDCPPVIAVFAQAAGGDGGGSRKDGIWIGQTFTGGGGGGSGAFWAFYLQMPYDTNGSYVEVLSYVMNKSISFSKNGSVFATVGAGSNGQTPSDKEYGTRAGGSGGSVSAYELPPDIKSCTFSTSSGNLVSMNSLGGVSGGGGGTGGGSFGSITEKYPSSDGGSMPTYKRFYLTATGGMVPPFGTYSSGSGSSSGGGAGGGGGGSRMGSGGNGAAGGNGYGGGGTGGAGGTGAGGGGGSTGGSGFAVNYNGGKGGDPYIAIVW